MTLFCKLRNDDFHYYTKPATSLTDEELAEISKLFSENYGIYSDKIPDEKRRGKQIVLKPSY